MHGLLGLARRRVDDAHAASMLEASRDRVRAIALAYAHGWRPAETAPDGRVDPTPALRALVDEVKQLHPVDRCIVSTRIDIGDVRVSFDQLVPLVLLARELVTNAFVHAFVGRANGELVLTLAPAPESRATLTIADDGVGLSPEHAARRDRNLGLSLVAMLAEQIEADVMAPPAPPTAVGCRWVLSFPLL